MWSPDQYLRFARERRQPFDDLVAMVERRSDMRVADLGCGTGELTRDLHDSLSARETVGIDSSPAMLAKARAFGHGSLRFAEQRIESFGADRPFDLILSNAAFHWVPDHVELFGRLTTCLAGGGQLAVQMPANDDHASHRLAAEVAAGFALQPRPDFLLKLPHYASLLHRLGFVRQQVRMQVYAHLLPSTEDVVEWVRGALLTHYQEQLGDRYPEFLDRYRERLHEELGDQRPYLYTYQRVFVWGALT